MACYRLTFVNDLAMYEGEERLWTPEMRLEWRSEKDFLAYEWQGLKIKQYHSFMSFISKAYVNSLTTHMQCNFNSMPHSSPLAFSYFLLGNSSTFNTMRKYLLLP